MNIAKPMRGQLNAGTNRASMSSCYMQEALQILITRDMTVWEDEEWLRQHNKPLGESAAADKQFAEEEE